MTSIRNTFLKGVETVFDVFNEAVKTGVYTVITDDGFDDISTTTDTVRCIFETLKEKDLNSLSFSKLIQPQDVVALMPSVDLVNCVMTTTGTILFDEDKYSVIAFEVDPMTVIYTLLFRKV
ncbi:MAG: hypothetical protein P9L97_05950 [Candidatus Tenebribacter davisii]|nr:hypothetical protein [Candidatus Tenebribacter davisii]